MAERDDVDEVVLPGETVGEFAERLGTDVQGAWLFLLFGIEPAREAEPS